MLAPFYYCFYPTSLIKVIFIIVINMLKHPAGTLTIGPTHQCFIGNNALVPPINNRLKSHTDLKAKILTTKTIATGLLFYIGRKLHLTGVSTLAGLLVLPEISGCCLCFRYFFANRAKDSAQRPALMPWHNIRPAPEMRQRRYYQMPQRHLRAPP